MHGNTGKLLHILGTLWSLTWDTYPIPSMLIPQPPAFDMSGICPLVGPGGGDLSETSARGWGICQFFYIDVYEINHIRTAEMKSKEEWSSQLWTQFMQLRKKPEKKIRDFNGIWTLWPRDASAMLQPTVLWSHWCGELVNYVFICSLERDKCDRCTCNKSCKNSGNEIKWRMILAVVNAIYAIA